MSDGFPRVIQKVEFIQHLCVTFGQKHIVLHPCYPTLCSEWFSSMIEVNTWLCHFPTSLPTSFNFSLNVVFNFAFNHSSISLRSSSNFSLTLGKHEAKEWMSIEDRSQTRCNWRGTWLGHHTY